MLIIIIIIISPLAQSRRQENYARHTKLWLQRQFTLWPSCCGKKPHFLFAEPLLLSKAYIGLHTYKHTYNNIRPPIKGAVMHTAYFSYDTIRDAILTCARKPTWIGLIYRTETTTKNCKTEKLKSKSRYVRSNSKSLGNHAVRSEKKKKKGCSGKDLQKKVFSFNVG